jgi:hypothetical protein
MAGDFPEMEYKAQVDEPIPDDISIPQLAEQVARAKVQVSQAQMRMIIELLPYHSPKLAAIGIGHLHGNDFSSRLDKAIERSNKALLIEGKVVEAQVEND